MGGSLNKLCKHLRQKSCAVTALLICLPVLCLTFKSALANDKERAAKLMDRLVAAYPNYLSSHDGTSIIWKDGTKMLFDDGKGDKDFKTRLNAPDLEDQFFVPYPRNTKPIPPAVNVDPGRVRYEPFFTKIYGNCRNGDVAPKLTTIVWLPKKRGLKIKVTRENNVATQLQKVSNELDKLPRQFDKFLTPLAGTYNCRTIAGTSRLSVHSFGAAIDLNTKFANYWRWSRRGSDNIVKYQNKIPEEIIEIFERHGFIWGGRWYHYDTMHFEYRPELLMK